MIALWILLCVLGLLFLLWIFLAAPGRKKNVDRFFRGVRYAHRGLHNEEHAENSLSAFAAAADAGFGIELDVRLSADGRVVVCHDASLSRVAGIDRKVSEMTAKELAAVSLAGTGEGVPTFAEVLNKVYGRVPILVEIKSDVASDLAICDKVIPLLAAYEGPFLVESFNPLALAKVRRALPDVLRGQLSGHLSKNEKQRSLSFRLLERFLLNFKARPNFIAYNRDECKFFPFRLQKFFFHPATFAWTVRSEEAEACAYDEGFDTVIFENYLPENPGTVGETQ